MKKYERQISFKTLFLTAIRRFDMFFVAFFIAALGSFIASKFIIKQTYYSTAAFERYDSVVKENQFNKTKEFVTSERTINATVKVLENENVYHANGNKITADEISKGLTVELLETNTIYITVKFESKDKTIPKPVLYHLSKVAIDQINSGSEDSIRGTKIASEASDPVLNNKNAKVLVTGLVSGLIVALVLAFVSEVILDEVYDVDDIEILGGKGYSVQFVGDKEQKLKLLLFFDGNKFIRKKEKDILSFKQDGTVAADIKTLQNELNINYKSNSICITSIGNDYLGALFGAVFSQVYTLNGKGNSLIELNSFNPQLESIISSAEKESYLQKLNQLSLKNYDYSSESFNSPEFDEILKKTSKKGEKLIILGPDISEHDDVSLLKEKIDCYLIVVQKNSTMKSTIYKTIQLLKGKGIENFAFVILK